MTKHMAETWVSHFSMRIEMNPEAAACVEVKGISFLACACAGSKAGQTSCANGKNLNVP